MKKSNVTTHRPHTRNLGSGVIGETPGSSRVYEPSSHDLPFFFLTLTSPPFRRVHTRTHPAYSMKLLSFFFTFIPLAVAALDSQLPLSKPKQGITILPREKVLQWVHPAWYSA